MEFLVCLRGSNGKKLIAFSAAVFLIITVIVFFAVFRISENLYLNQMSDYLGELPKIIEGRKNEMAMRGRVYEDDIMTRAEIGLKLYEEENGFTGSEKLEKVRDSVFADSVSITDGQGNLISTTGPASPEEGFRAYIRTLEPRSPHLEYYPELTKDGKETGKNDGKGFVMLPISGDIKSNLVFEFPCETMLKLYNAFSDWADIFERMLSGADAAVFAKTDGKISGYPLNGLTAEQTSRLFDELTKIFQNAESFRRTENGIRSKLITLQGRYYLAALMNYPQENTDILMTASVRQIIGNFISVAVAISAIIGWGIALIQIYIFRCILQKKNAKEMSGISLKWVLMSTWPGIVAVLVVTVVFLAMLLMLENQSNSSFIAATKRISVQREIDWSEAQANTLSNAFADIYRTRAKILADFLTKHPDYQTREGLSELSRIAKTDYLMRFDGTGQEIFSSNSYTGFSVGKNLSEKYRAVLMGYPYAVAGPEEDPYTGQIQIGTAILMTDSKGQSDGFLLAVYSAGALNAELERMSYENTVNSFAVQDGHIAAAISDKDGRFIAHTDHGMIGQRALSSLEDYEPGVSFEGLTDYDGEEVCISASNADGITLLFIVPGRIFSYSQGLFAGAALPVLLILALLYYPIAGLLIARAVQEAGDSLKNPDASENLAMILFDGYVIFALPFTIFAFIANINGWLTSFDYVFRGEWSRGVHLFSLWAALLIVGVTLCCKFLLQAVLNLSEDRLSLKSKTITRLVRSLIDYTVNVFLIVCILEMFGVNTSTLLASAGILSIAIGMGAQSIAADLLAGFFMMLEGSVHVGDYVSVAGVTGHVTDMGIRTIELTDEDGNIVILNNSKVSSVRNMSRNHSHQEESD